MILLVPIEAIQYSQMLDLAGFTVVTIVIL